MTEPGTSSIVALDWNTQGKLLWEVRFDEPRAAQSARRRPRGRSASRGRRSPTRGTSTSAVTDRAQQTTTYVACFDAETGNRRWIRYLGTASPESST